MPNILKCLASSCLTGPTRGIHSKRGLQGTRALTSEQITVTLR